MHLSPFSWPLVNCAKKTVWWNGFFNLSYFISLYNFTTVFQGKHHFLTAVYNILEVASLRKMGIFFFLTPEKIETERVLLTPRKTEKYSRSPFLHCCACLPYSGKPANSNRKQINKQELQKNTATILPPLHLSPVDSVQVLASQENVQVLDGILAQKEGAWAGK